MKHIPVQRGVSAALFHFQETTPGEYCLTRSQSNAGQVVLKALHVLVEQGLQTAAIYSDCLMNLRGFPCDCVPQAALPFEVGLLSDLIPGKRAGHTRVEALSIDGAGGLADCVGNKLDEEPGLVISPHVAISVITSLAIIVLVYEGGDRLMDENFTPLRLAVSRDLVSIDPDFFSGRKRGNGETPFLTRVSAEITLDRVLGARPIMSQGNLHIAAWVKPPN